MGLLSPNFFIHTISIGSVEGASCVNFGNNLPSGFTSHKKQNQGFGTIQGDHIDISRMLTRLDDDDDVDMLNLEGAEDNVPEWIKELLHIQFTHHDGEAKGE